MRNCERRSPARREKKKKDKWVFVCPQAEEEKKRLNEIVDGDRKRKKRGKLVLEKKNVNAGFS